MYSIDIYIYTLLYIFTNKKYTRLHDTYMQKIYVCSFLCSTYSIILYIHAIGYI